MFQALAFRRGQIFSGLAAAALVFVTPACKTYSEKLVPISAAWEAGRFAEADAALDELIADEAGVELARVRDSRGRDETIDLGKTNTTPLLLEKGMSNLVMGEPEAAIAVWRRCRDVLDERFKNGGVDYFAATIGDDTSLAFAGADYEHLLVRAMLALAELIAKGPMGEAYPYAYQIGEKQEELIGSTFGEKEGYQPRKLYQRLAIGAYLEGVIQEADVISQGEARLKYARALEYAGQSPLIEGALARLDSGAARSSEGTGVVHVFYLGGRGPLLVEGVSVPSAVARDIIVAGAIVTSESVGPLFQKQIPVPVVAVRDNVVPPLSISVGGEVRATSELLLDVNQVATQQLEANMPMIVARAIVRRVLKSVGSKAAGDAAGEQDKQVGQVVEVLANLFSTAFERADTRNWSTLPAQIHVARFELPSGPHELSFDASMASVPVVVDTSRDTFVVIVRPNIVGPGAVLVDSYSRVASE